MGKILGRPVVLLPLGVVALLVGLLVALNSIGAGRWGGVVEAGTACESPGQEMCLVRDDVSLDGPHSSRRSAGDDWDLTPASGEPEEVSLPGDALDDVAAREGVMLSQPDGDVVGVEVDAVTTGTTWVGGYGVLQLLGLGLMVLSLGAGLVLVALRMRRSTGSWSAHESVQQHGSALLALPVVLGLVLWMAPRFIW
ncbi:hypothetical protein [Nocardioides aestuarii]|uniref:Uncharacterized protein n=1 Tax=Nocardioides aestuarii TaxID=252231 RepID=A0ABW4TMH4_9ACTN